MFANKKDSLADFRGKYLSDGNLLISAGFFTEIGLSTEMELSSGSGNFVENVPLIYNKGCGLGDGCPTRDPLPWPAPARQRSLCSGAFAHPSLATLLQCFAVIAIPEYEADDELYAVAILREKPRPQPPGVRHYFVGVTRSLGGGPENSSATFANPRKGTNLWPFPWKCHEGTGQGIP